MTSQCIAAYKKLDATRKDGSLLCKRRDREDLKLLDIRSVTANPPCSPFVKGGDLLLCGDPSAVKEGDLLPPCAPISRLSPRMWRYLRRDV